MTIAFIPIRSMSKSIPEKNIKLFNSKPLVYWVIQAAQKSSHIEQIYVAVDSDKFYYIVSQMQSEFPKLHCYRRNWENAQDHSSTESVLIEFVNHHSFSDQDRIVLIQATSPLTEAWHLDEAISMHQTGQYDSILSAVKTHRFIWNQKGESINYDFQNRPLRGEWSGNFTENGAFYIAYVKDILHYSNRLSGKIGIYEMDEKHLMEIDTTVDWEILEYISSSHRQWGEYKNIASGKDFLVKELIIDSHSQLSLQKHQKRAEVHILVEGEIHLLIGDRMHNMICFQPYHIDRDTLHQLINKSANKARVIEIQHGIIEESDIIKYPS